MTVDMLCEGGPFAREKSWRGLGLSSPSFDQFLSGFLLSFPAWLSDFLKAASYDPISFAGLICRRSTQAAAARGCKTKHPFVHDTFFNFSFNFRLLSFDLLFGKPIL